MLVLLVLGHTLSSRSEEQRVSALVVHVRHQGICEDADSDEAAQGVGVGAGSADPATTLLSSKGLEPTINLWRKRGWDLNWTLESR